VVVTSDAAIAAGITSKAAASMSSSATVAIRAILLWEQQPDTSEIWVMQDDTSEIWVPQADTSETWAAVA
jgi:hypothetical protein